MSTQLRLRAAAAATALACVLAACAAPSPGPTGTPSGPAPADPGATLAARATSAEAVARYEQMEQHLRAALDGALGPLPWAPENDGDQAGCDAPFTGLDGRVVYLQPWRFTRPVSDADWPRVEQIVTGVIAGYGFTTPTLQVDSPGHHESDHLDPALGARFTFGTQGYTDMQVTTGCHRTG